MPQIRRRQFCSFIFSICMYILDYELFYKFYSNMKTSATFQYQNLRCARKCIHRAGYRYANFRLYRFQHVVFAPDRWHFYSGDQKHSILIWCISDVSHGVDLLQFLLHWNSKPKDEGLFQESFTHWVCLICYSAIW